MVPCYIWMILLLLSGVVEDIAVTNGQSCWLVLFNLQGISFLVDAANWAQMSGGLGHLWFLTALMFCYACLPLLQKAQSRIHTLSKPGIVCLLIGAFMLKCLCDYTIGLHLGYLLTFSIGYFWSRIWSKPSFKAVVGWCCVAVVSCALRMGGKVLWDDTFLYNQIIVSVSQTLLAISIFQVLYWAHSQTRQTIPHIAAWGGGITIY